MQIILFIREQKKKKMSLFWTKLLNTKSLPTWWEMTKFNFEKNENVTTWNVKIIILHENISSGRVRRIERGGRKISGGTREVQRVDMWVLRFLIGFVI